MNENPILVAISCITYNHKDYLRQCLDGFVMQKTNFRYVAVVHDDCSTDGTTDILRDYAAKYPDIILPIYEEENQYSKHNGAIGRKMHETFDRLGAKYIAICEGDDYWTDPYKLQKQVDILEKDESLIACVTNCSNVDEHRNVIDETCPYIVNGNVEGRYTLRDFFYNDHRYPTMSVVYRNVHSDVLQEKLKVMKNRFFGDWTLWIALLCFGDFYFLNEVTCAYRINPTSVTHDKNTLRSRRIGQAKDFFRLFPLVASILPEQYSDIKAALSSRGVDLYLMVAHAYRKAHQYFHMIYWVLKGFFKDPKGMWWQLKNKFF